MGEDKKKRMGDPGRRMNTDHDDVSGEDEGGAGDAGDQRVRQHAAPAVTRPTSAAQQ